MYEFEINHKFQENFANDINYGFHKNVGNKLQIPKKIGI